MHTPTPDRRRVAIDLSLLLLICAALQACSGLGAYVPGKGDELGADAGVDTPTESPIEIDEVRLVGNEQIPAEELLPYLGFGKRKSWFGSTPGRYDSVALDEALDQLANVYRRRGFFAAQIDRELSFDEARTHVEITVRIEEGEQIHVSSLRIETALGANPPAVPIAELAANLPLSEGDVFEIARYDASKQQILRGLREAGHLEAKLEGGAEIDVPEGSARIRWQLVPGPLVLLGSIRIEGLDQLERRVIEQEIEGTPGQPLPASWLEATQRRLAELGWFRSVTVRALPTPPQAEPAQSQPSVEASASTGEDAGRADSDRAGDAAPLASWPDAAASGDPTVVGVDPSSTLPGAQTWPVAIRVEERPPRSVLASIGYGTEDRARVEFGWQHRHLLGSGRALRVRARHSSLLTGLEFDVLIPRFAGTRAQANLSLDSRLETLEAYDARRIEAKLEFGRSLSNGGRFAFGQRVELTRTDDVSPAAESILDDPEQSSLQSALFAQLDVGRLDDRASPTSGQSARFSTQLATQALGSENEFLRSELDLRAFRPITRFGLNAPGVLAGRLRLGTTLPFGATQDDDIPLTERFFAGGGDSVRGFEFQQLGPLDASGEPLGGTSLLIANLEWRVPLTQRFGSVLFVDAGQVDLEPLRFTASELFYAAGAGLRLNTPVGPIRLDLASLLNRPIDQDRFRIHFSIGHTF